MSDDLPPDANLICPACFAREIEPLFLRKDPENGEYYCQSCAYVAPDKQEVVTFLQEVVWRKYRIRRPGF
jgi:hypothetical protein